jgi:hypothetical protein
LGGQVACGSHTGSSGGVRSTSVHGIVEVLVVLVLVDVLDVLEDDEVVLVDVLDVLVVLVVLVVEAPGMVVVAATQSMNRSLMSTVSSASTSLPITCRRALPRKTATSARYSHVPGLLHR